MIVEGYPKTRKMVFLDLVPLTLQNSGIFHDSTRLHLNGQQDQSKSQIQIQGNRGIFDWAALLICC